MPRPDDVPAPRRRDPAWVWYALAAGGLALILLAEFSGLLDALTP
jgi:hypothetical protein